MAGGTTARSHAGMPAVTLWGSCRGSVSLGLEIEEGSALLPSTVTPPNFISKKGRRSNDSVDVTRLSAQAPLLRAGLAVGSSGHGVFKAVWDFGEEAGGHAQPLASAECALPPPPCTAGRRESPGSAAAKSEFLAVGCRDSEKWIIPLKPLEYTGVFLPLAWNPQAGCSGVSTGVPWQRRG